jgi:hypothetical protein
MEISIAQGLPYINLLLKPAGITADSNGEIGATFTVKLPL